MMDVLDGGTVYAVHECSAWHCLWNFPPPPRENFSGSSTCHPMHLWPSTHVRCRCSRWRTKPRLWKRSLFRGEGCSANAGLWQTTPLRRARSHALRCASSTLHSELALLLWAARATRLPVCYHILYPAPDTFKAQVHPEFTVRKTTFTSPRQLVSLGNGCGCTGGSIVWKDEAAFWVAAFGGGRQVGHAPSSPRTMLQVRLLASRTTHAPAFPSAFVPPDLSCSGNFKRQSRRSFTRNWRS